MFEIIREQLPGREILHWQRWTDGCGSQFRSRFVNVHLKKARETFELESSSFCYFEAHEGKNVSDTIGSIIKCAFTKEMNTFNEGIESAHDVVKLVTEGRKERTEKFEFFIIEEFGSTERIPAKERPAIPLPGIQKTHYLYVFDDTLYAKELGCTVCTVDSVCESCRTSKPVEESLLASCTGNESEVEFDDVHDDEDAGRTDVESDDDDTSDASFKPGDIVWAKYG